MRTARFLPIILTASVGVCSGAPDPQTVREVASFPARDFAAQRPFTLSGVVTAEDGDTIVLEDETGALRISNESAPPVPFGPLREPWSESAGTDIRARVS